MVRVFTGACLSCSASISVQMMPLNSWFTLPWLWLLKAPVSFKSLFNNVIGTFKMTNKTHGNSSSLFNHSITLLSPSDNVYLSLKCDHIIYGLPSLF